MVVKYSEACYYLNAINVGAYFETKMKSVRVSMPDDVFQRLKIRAKKDKHAGIASLLLSSVGEQNEASTTMDIVKQALKLAQRREAGAPFRLRDLFDSSRWDALETGIRIRAGRQFFAAVQMEPLPIRAVKGVGHQHYVRTKSRSNS